MAWAWWGYKTVAVFDVWSIEHFFTGINVFFLSYRWHRLFDQPRDKSRWFSLFGWIVAAAYGWETLEHYLETGLAGARAAYWFQGVEFWANRLLSDPLLIVVGAAVGFRYPWLDYPAKVFSIGWVLVHVFLFPDSMYLQRLDLVALFHG